MSIKMSHFADVYFNVTIQGIDLYKCLKESQAVACHATYYIKTFSIEYPKISYVSPDSLVKIWDLDPQMYTLLGIENNCQLCRNNSTCTKILVKYKKHYYVLEICD